MASTAERDAMTRALSLAAGPGPDTHPNPRVGAVILDPTGSIVGSGVHRGPGHPHAEVVALSQAGSEARGATAVVTLEPCHHTGRTGPCTDALLAAGIERVIYAQSDPNPVATGGGMALAAAGVAVEADVRADEARAINPIWTFAMEHQRPLVTWKFASTVDGRVAAPDGSSRWISGPASRAEVHRLRRNADAVMVGTGTVVVDDAWLTARDESGALFDRQPLRVVVGHRAVPQTARVLDPAAETLVMRTHDVTDVLETLFARDVHHALLEGGPTLAAAFLQVDAIDRVIGYVGPRLLGDGPSLVGSWGVHTMGQARQLCFDEVGLVGDDICWTARLTSAAPPLIRKDL